MPLVEDDTMAKSVSENIQYYMKQLGISRAELGRALNISYSTLTGWIHGISCPRMDKIQALADYFGCRVSDLVTGPGSCPDEPVRIHVLGSLDPADVIEDVFIREGMYPQGEYIGLKIHGDSMAPRLCSGDTVIVRRQESAETGDTVIAEVNGDLVCKKLQNDKDGITLAPANEKYRPIHYGKDDLDSGLVQIVGKVVEVMGKV